MRHKNDVWRGLLADALLVCGAVLLAVGAGLVYLPAGLLTGGGLCMLGGIAAALPGKGDGS